MNAIWAVLFRDVQHVPCTAWDVTDAICGLQWSAVLVGAGGRARLRGAGVGGVPGAGGCPRGRGDPYCSQRPKCCCSVPVRMCVGVVVNVFSPRRVGSETMRGRDIWPFVAQASIGFGVVEISSGGALLQLVACCGDN